MAPGRLLRSLGFVAAIYAFGTFLTSADAGPAPAERLLFVLFGANGSVGLDCEGNRQAMPCTPRPPAEAAATVEILDVTSGTPTRRASIALDAAAPASLAVAPDGSRAYVVDSLRKSVLTVAAASGTVTATTPVPDGPVDCVLSGDGASLYVTTAKPSVVTVATALATIVSEAAPRQPYAERFSGIALDPAPGGGTLAVAATSSAPAVYLFAAGDTSVTVGRRAPAAAACTRPACGGGDDVAFTGDGRVLLANLACSELYAFAAASATQISGGSFGANACLAPNPHNSLLWNPLSRRAQVVWRGYSMGIAPGLPVVDPESLGAALLTSKLRIPEAAAMTRDGRLLFIVSRTTTRGVPAYQVKGPLTFVLETYDVRAGAYAPEGTFAFDLPVEGRAAIDAKLVERAGPLPTAARALPLAGAGGLGAGLRQISLAVFAGALLLVDRRRPRRRV